MGKEIWSVAASEIGQNISVLRCMESSAVTEARQIIVSSKAAGGW